MCCNNDKITAKFGVGGGALAANQFEGGYDKGGKGLSVIDVLTSGAHGKARQDARIYRIPITIIQIMKVLIFIIVIRKILPCLKKWD